VSLCILAECDNVVRKYFAFQPAEDAAFGEGEKNIFLLARCFKDFFASLD
jgi:hypothetical protein